jgi:hypothetical protein
MQGLRWRGAGGAHLSARRASGDDEMLAAADEMTVASVLALVAPATDSLEHKLLSLGPHSCDFGRILPAARALREQVDWAALHARTSHHPYAESFLLLADRLGISGRDAVDATRAVTPEQAPGHQIPHDVQVLPTGQPRAREGLR